MVAVFPKWRLFPKVDLWGLLVTVDPLLTDPHGTGPGSDNLKGRLKRAPNNIYKIRLQKYRNIQFPA
jgi:hypothetical protein